MATEAVKFTLVSLWSRIPDLPLEEVLEGVIHGLGREACIRTCTVAENVVASFVPEAVSDDLVAQLVDPKDDQGTAGR